MRQFFKNFPNNYPDNYPNDIDAEIYKEREKIDHYCPGRHFSQNARSAREEALCIKATKRLKMLIKKKNNNY